jgi:hypothetical protein
VKRSALVFVLALVAGCQRKAPGPEECVALAYHLFGVQSERDLENPRVRAKVDEQIQECLVTPYDRELVLCLERGGRARTCEYAFVERRTRGESRVLPRAR